MKIPGIGNRKKRFQLLIGWGKEKRHERTRDKLKVKKKYRLPRNVRHKRTRRDKNK